MSVLIAGIGNIFLGDDGFGSEVARRLAERAWPAEVQVVDYGIRGFDVAFALMNEPDLAILMDATSQGGTPGTLYLIEPDAAELNNSQLRELPVDTHAMTPTKVFQLVRAMDGRLGRVLVVGCEPGDFGPADEGRMGLSPAVAAAVDEAIKLIEKLVAEFHAKNVSAGSPRGEVTATPHHIVSYT